MHGRSKMGGGSRTRVRWSVHGAGARARARRTVKMGGGSRTGVRWCGHGAGAGAARSEIEMNWFVWVRGLDDEAVREEVIGDGAG